MYLSVRVFNRQVKKERKGRCFLRWQARTDEAARSLQVPALAPTAAAGDALLGELVLPSFPAGHSAPVEIVSKKSKSPLARTLIFHSLSTDNQLATELTSTGKTLIRPEDSSMCQPGDYK